MSPYKDARVRSLTKELSWRVCATIATVLIVYVFTREWILSLGVGAVEVAVKLGLYYVHERLWQRIGFGKGRLMLVQVEQHSHS